MTGELLTLDEVAARLRTTPQRIRMMCKAGELAHIEYPTFAIPADEVDAFIQQQLAATRRAAVGPAERARIAVRKLAAKGALLPLPNKRP